MIQKKKNTANADKQKNTSAISSVSKNSFCGKKEKISKKKFATNFNNFFNILVRSSVQSGLTEVIEECVQRNVCVSVR